MVETSQIRAFKKFGVGYFITEQLKIRNIKLEDIADYISVTPEHLNLIIMGKLPLDFEIARSLGKVFNTSAQYLINLDEGFYRWAKEK